MLVAPIECGPDRRLKLQLGLLHGVAISAIAVSALPWPLRLALIAMVLAALARVAVQPRQWLYHDAAGWWLAGTRGADWEGPWQLGPGGYLGGGMAIIELRRDRRSRRCIICRDGLAPGAWRSLRVHLAH